MSHQKSDGGVRYLENPFDLFSLMESIEIAKSQNKEVLFMDRLIGTLRLDPEADLVNLNYRTLTSLGLLSLNSANTTAT